MYLVLCDSKIEKSFKTFEEAKAFAYALAKQESQDGYNVSIEVYRSEQLLQVEVVGDEIIEVDLKEVQQNEEE